MEEELWETGGKEAKVRNGWDKVREESRREVRYKRNYFPSIPDLDMEIT
jgi:hypothetical protein